MNFACIKKQFASWKEAKECHWGQRPYFCGRCGHWHLTSDAAGRLNKEIRWVSKYDTKRWLERKSQRRRYE